MVKFSMLVISTFLLLLPSTEVFAAISTLSYNSTTGAFTLSMPVTAGTLVSQGVLQSDAVQITAAIQGQSDALSLSAQASGNLLEVSVSFGATGAMSYQLGGQGVGFRARLISTTIPAGHCKDLDANAALSGVREAYHALQVDRAWESSPQAGIWFQVINDLALFFIATDLSADCSAMARTQDNRGCDFPFEHWSCTPKGGCCDEHDSCYANRECNMASWACGGPGLISYVMCEAGGGAPCALCNGAVVLCFAFQSPGPAACCSDYQDPCGTPRGPGLLYY